MVDTIIIVDEQTVYLMSGASRLDRLHLPFQLSVDDASPVQKSNKPMNVYGWSGGEPEHSWEVVALTDAVWHNDAVPKARGEPVKHRRRLADGVPVISG